MERLSYNCCSHQSACRRYRTINASLLKKSTDQLFNKSFTGVLTLSFSAEPIDTIVAAGSSVMLPCAADQQDSTVQHAWYRNGNPVSLGDVFNLATDGSLKISVPEATTAYEQFDGLYHCIMSNVSHQLRSKHASILGNYYTKPLTLGRQRWTDGQTERQTDSVLFILITRAYMWPCLYGTLTIAQCRN